MGLFAELNRRHVIRVAAAYVVTAWLVIQVVETILPAFGFGDAAVRNVTIAFAIGLVPALVLAWVFEWTPEGLKRESETGDGQPASVQATRRLDRAILVVLALALAYFAVDKFLVEPRQRSEALSEAREQGRTEALVDRYGEKSIAVLPFVNMSSDPEQEYFSDGIAEEILNVLAGIPDLRVISRSSSFAYKDGQKEIPEIAELLRVAHVLEGSVRRSGDTVRITAQLIEARSDTHLWSQTWDREFRDIFVIQDEIAAQVADRLQLTLLGDQGVTRGVDPRAYELVLGGRYLLYDFDGEKASRAESLLLEAIGIAPEYAPAHAWLAEAYRQLSNMSRDQQRDFKGLFGDALTRALELDPDEPRALTLEGYRHYFGAAVPDAGLARRYWQRAIAADPSNGDARRWLAFTYLSTDPRKSLELMRLAYQVDPLRPILGSNLATILLQAEEFDEAMTVARNLHRVQPQDFQPYLLATRILSRQGRQQDALKVYYRAFQLSQERMPYQFLVWHLIDHMTTPREIVAAWLNFWKEKAGEHYFSNRTDLSAEGAYLIVYGQPGDAESFIQRMLEMELYSPAWSAYMLLRASPDYPRIRDLYDQGFAEINLDPLSFDLVKIFDGRWDIYIDYALVLSNTGDEQQASQLAEKILAYLGFLVGQQVVFGPSGSPLQFFRAEVLAILGRPAEATAALRQAHDSGNYLCGTCIHVFPHFNNLRDEPEFVALLNAIDERNAATVRALQDEGMLLTPAQVLAMDPIEFDPFTE